MNPVDRPNPVEGSVAFTGVVSAIFIPVGVGHLFVSVAVDVISNFALFA